MVWEPNWHSLAIGFSCFCFFFSNKKYDSGNLLYSKVVCVTISVLGIVWFLTPLIGSWCVNVSVSIHGVKMFHMHVCYLLVLLVFAEGENRTPNLFISIPEHTHPRLPNHILITPFTCLLLIVILIFIECILFYVSMYLVIWRFHMKWRLKVILVYEKLRCISRLVFQKKNPTTI
jgi:hypothetical protein